MSSTRALAAALLAALALPATADDLSELAGLLDEPVVSTASKSSEAAAAAPASTSVITSEDLRLHGFTTLDEAIDFLGVGLLTERSFATPEIGARGVLLTGDYGNHVLLLVDGHAVNEPWDGSAYYDQSLGVPLDLVDHIEIILGPGSVLYGSNAMLGVIHVITKQAKDYQGLHLVADGLAPSGLHLAGGLGERFTLGGREGALTLGLDLHQTWGPQAFFAAQPMDAGDGTTVTWGGREATHREVTVPSGYLRLVMGELDVALRAASSRRAATSAWTRFDDPNDWERDRWLSLDAKWRRTLSPSLAVGVRLYGDLYDYFDQLPSGTPNDCLGPNDCLYRNAGASRWMGSELDASFDWLRDGRFVTLLGVDGRLRHVSSWTSYQDAVTSEVEVVSPYTRNGWELGAYAQQTAQLAAGLSVNAGVRFDRDEVLDGHLSPRAAAVLSTWEGARVKLIYAEAFRAPSYFERYYADGLNQIAPQHLDPEQVRSVEVALEQRLGAQRARLGAFRSWYSGLVQTVTLDGAEMGAAEAAGVLDPAAQLGSVVQFRNVASVDSRGLELAWDGSAAEHLVRYGAGLTVAHARTGSDARLPGAAQAYGNVHASYELGEGRPTFALALRWVASRPLANAAAGSQADADALVQLHAAVTAPLGHGLAARLAGSWSSTTDTAYLAGPDRSQVLPAPRWQGLLGLRWDSAP